LQHRLNCGPFIVGEFIAHDSKPPVWEFESQVSGQRQRFWPGPGAAVAFEAKPISNGTESPQTWSKITQSGREPLADEGFRMIA
jgi:hypothetical protein